MLADNLTAETAHGNDFLMRMQLLFYISGHGYGHATRSSEVLRELARQQPGWRLHVRSNVPEHLFAGIDHLTFHRLRESLDPGVVEDADSLGIDVAVTLDAIERYYRRCSQILAAEAAWVRSQEIDHCRRFSSVGGRNRSRLRIAVRGHRQRSRVASRPTSARFRRSGDRCPRFGDSSRPCC